jgi:hypothetical protein
MKKKLPLFLIILGGFLITLAGINILQAIAYDRGLDPLVLTLGIIGGVLVWRGLLLRFPNGLRSRQIRPRIGEEWTIKTGTSRPSFLKDPAGESSHESS